jgi:hypothetical protein
VQPYPFQHASDRCVRLPRHAGRKPVVRSVRLQPDQPR